MRSTTWSRRSGAREPFARWRMSSIWARPRPPVSAASSSGVSSKTTSGNFSRSARAKSARTSSSGFGTSTISAAWAQAKISPETSPTAGASSSTRGRRAAILGSAAQRARVVMAVRSTLDEGPDGARAWA